MAILHGHHVWDVLHYKCARLQEPDNADKLLVEAVARIVQIPRPDLAEPLARRPPIDHVDFAGDELVKTWYARLCILQEASDITFE
jgi:hypothetical protein